MIPSGSAEKVGDFQLLRTDRGLEVLVHGTRKFKTVVVRVHFRGPLGPGSCVRGLLPSLLRRGSRQYPSMVDVARILESLYGASWSASTYRLGDEQVLSFRMEVVHPRHLPGHPDLLEPAFRLIHEFLTRPVQDPAGFFPREVFEQERLNLRREIEAQYNDKHSYAMHRMLRLMFPTDPYGSPPLGTVEEVDALTQQTATEAWQEMLHRLPCRVYAVGDVDPEDIRSRTQQSCPFQPSPEAPPGRLVPQWGTAPRRVVEEQPVSQSKLVIGYPVDLSALSERQFDALRVYASLLGGGFHSRLFQVVRERHSLAYHVSCAMDRLKGVLSVHCGIDAADQDRVLELIGAELASLQEQPPDLEEHRQSVRLSVTSARTVADSPGGMVDVVEGGLACGRVRALQEIARSLESVTPEDLCAAAARIGPPQVIYCLHGESQRHA